MNRERVRLALESARSLHEVINMMTEEELLEALRVESAAQRRQTQLERMVARLSALRAMRIKDELVEEFTPWRMKIQSS